MIAALRDLSLIENRAAFRFTLIQQIPCALFSALMLDGGQMAKICAAAMLGYWVGVLWLLNRRPLSKSRTDLVFVRWGFITLFVASLSLAGVVRWWHDS